MTKRPIYAITSLLILFSISGTIACSRASTTMSVTAVSVVGIGQYSTGGNDGWRPVAPGTVLPVNALVRTADQSMVRLVLSDKSVLVLGPGTVLGLSRLSIEKGCATGTMRLYLGLLRAKIEKISVSHDYTFHTPVAIASVRGTEFVLEARNSGRSYIAVVEGSVAVSAVKPAGEASVPAVMVADKQQLDIAPEKPLPKPAVLEERTITQYDIEKNSARFEKPKGILPAVELSAGGELVKVEPPLIRVILFDETEYVGVIIQEDENTIRLRTEFGVRSVSRADVKKIVPEGKK